MSNETPNERHVEILAEAIKEYNKYVNEQGMFTYEREKWNFITYTALVTLQGECDADKEMLQNTINFNVRANIGLVKTIDDQLKTIASLKEEVERLKFMVDNGLGYKDMVNYNKPPQEI